MNSLAPVFCSVVEPQRNWLHAVSLLIYSLRRNGGAYATRPFALLVAGKARTLELIGEDQASGVLVFGIDRHQTIPHLNKLAALHLDDAIEFSHLILLDHDTIILRLQDLPHFLTNEVYARRNYKYGLAHRFGRDYTVPLMASQKPWARIAYFNSGVVFVPRSQCRPLRSAWQSWADALSGPYHGHPLAEQLAFAMALATAKLPYSFLAVQYNQINWRELSADAAIIHYNSFDHTNRHVKNEALQSYEGFRQFLADTENRFWRRYGTQTQALLGPNLEQMAGRLWGIVQNWGR
jgi:hypothetical protein